VAAAAVNGSDSDGHWWSVVVTAMVGDDGGGRWVVLVVLVVGGGDGGRWLGWKSGGGDVR